MFIKSLLFFFSVLEKEFDVLVCWTAVDGELVRGALLPTLSLKYKYRVHAVPLSTQPDTCEYFFATYVYRYVLHAIQSADLSPNGKHSAPPMDIGYIK